MKKIVNCEFRLDDNGNITKVIVKVKDTSKGADNHALAANVSIAFFGVAQQCIHPHYKELSVNPNPKRPGIVNISFKLQKGHGLTVLDIATFIDKFQKTIDKTSVV